MKRRIISAIGAALFATGCIVPPDPMLETGSITRPAPTADTALRREVALLRAEVRRMADEMNAVTASTTTRMPVERLRSDLERLNAIIAALQTDIAETRKRVDQTAAATSRDDDDFRAQQAADIIDLRQRIDRTNAMLLEVARSLARRPANSGLVRANSKSAPSR